MSDLLVDVVIYVAMAGSTVALGLCFAVLAEALKRMRIF